MTDESNKIEQILNNSLADESNTAKENLLADMQGYSDHALDDNCRLILPSRFTNCFTQKGSLIITRGFDNTLWIFHPDTWVKLKTKLKEMATIDTNALMLHRYLVGSAEQVPIDSAWRFMIPQHLRQLAGIQAVKNEKTVVLQGIPNRIEIWSKNLWQDYNAKINDEQLIAAMKATGFTF